MQLQEEGVVHLDDKLFKYLDQKLLLGIHKYKGKDLSNTLTLRHLVSHTSGLPEYLTDAPKGQKGLLEEVVQHGDKKWDLTDVIGRAKQTESKYAPLDGNKERKHICYSDTNFQLLMGVIESVTGKCMESVFKEKIFNPLQLQSTWHPQEVFGATQMQVASIWAGQEIMHLPQAMVSFGDLYATAADVLTFMQSLMQGKLFKNPQTLQQMTSHWNPFGFALVPVAPGWPIEYGLAMMRFRAPGVLKYFIKIPAMMGHSGATGSWLFYVPQADLYITGTVNQLTAAPIPFRQVPKLVLDLMKLKDL
jgi:D-alanyl-D-alanine carboxypeptidase